MTYERAKRVQRVGWLVSTVGGSVGLAVWFFAFSGDLNRMGAVMLIVFGGSVVSVIGYILERFAKQLDVGRQTRQP
jgi:uncharacterized membrane protein